MVCQAGFWSCTRVRAGSLPSSCLHMSTAGKASPALHSHRSANTQNIISSVKSPCATQEQGRSAAGLDAGGSSSWEWDRSSPKCELRAQTCSTPALTLPQLLPLSQAGALFGWGGWEGQLPWGHGSCSARFSSLQRTRQSPQALLADGSVVPWQLPQTQPCSEGSGLDTRPGCISDQQWAEMTKNPLISVF